MPRTRYCGRSLTRPGSGSGGWRSWSAGCGWTAPIRARRPRRNRYRGERTPPRGASDVRGHHRAAWRRWAAERPNGFKSVGDSLPATAPTWAFSRPARYVIQDHPVYIPRDQRWPLRPELAAPLGVCPLSLLGRCADGRAGWRLSGDVAVPCCCTALASSALPSRAAPTFNPPQAEPTRTLQGMARAGPGRLRPGPCLLAGVSVEAPGSSATSRVRWPGPFHLCWLSCGHSRAWGWRGGHVH